VQGIISRKICREKYTEKNAQLFSMIKMNINYFMSLIWAALILEINIYKSFVSFMTGIILNILEK